MKKIYPTLLDKSWRPHNYKRLYHPLDDIVDRVDGQNFDFLDVTNSFLKPVRRITKPKAAKPVAQKVPEVAKSEPKVVAEESLTTSLAPVVTEKETTVSVPAVKTEEAVTEPAVTTVAPKEVTENVEAKLATTAEVTTEKSQTDSAEPKYSAEPKSIPEIVIQPANKDQADLEVVTEIIKVERVSPESDAQPTTEGPKFVAENLEESKSAADAVTVEAPSVAEVVTEKPSRRRRA